MDFNWFVLPFLTIGGEYSLMGGNLKGEDINNTGAVKGITNHYLGLHLGYYHAFNKEWNLHTLAGFGEVNNVNRAPDSRFTENGNSLMLRSELGYRFDKTGAIFIKATLRWNRMDIDTPPTLHDYINKHSLLLLGFGVRLHLQNRNG